MLNRLVCIALTALAGICVAQDHLPLEPKSNTWELNVILDDVGVIDLRGVQDVYIPVKGDELASLLGRDDLPERQLKPAEQGEVVLLPMPKAKRYVYFLFTLENRTQRPVIDPSTTLPKVDADGKVVYEDVAINTLRVIPDDTYLEIDTITEKIQTQVEVSLEMDATEGDMTDKGLWPKKIAAIDVRLEAPITPEERAAFRTGLIYLSEFIRQTSEFDFINGTDVLPESIPAGAKIRGVAFFADIPDDVDNYSLYFSGISNRYRVQRTEKEKTAYFQRMVRFSFAEVGDEFEITKDLLSSLKKERIYRNQFMGIYKGQRRLEAWETERQEIERLGMTDPVEKWETEGTLSN